MLTFNAASLFFFLVCGGVCHAEESLEKIVEGLHNESHEVRKKAREKLLSFQAADVEKHNHTLLSHYVGHRSPEVRLAMKRVLMNRIVGKGFLGVQHQGAVLVHEGKRYICRTLTRVNAGGPAELSGLRAGDMVFTVGDAKPTLANPKIAINLQLESTSDAFSNAIKSYSPGTKIKIVVRRGGELKTFEPVLGSYQAYLKEGKNLGPFMRRGEERDEFGYSEQEYEEFEQRVKEFKAKLEGDS